MSVVRLQDRYELHEELGRGAFGTVYRARDSVLGRDVAIKMLEAGLLDDEGRDRLLREARAAAALNHPHIVAIYDSGAEQGRPFLVMELVTGGNLRESGALSLDELRDVALQLCDALGHAHAHGIVHRDLKPENVMIADGPSAKLTDLGIAFTRQGTRLTSDGSILGTAAYLAPEQALGIEVDGRADLYALGVMLYERVAGRLPFQADDPLAVISQHLYAPVVPPRTYRADLPPALEGVILRLLAKSPDARFANAAEAAEALRAASLAAPAEGTVPGGERMLVLDQLARGRLIGRRRELEELRELWVRAHRGQGRLALVSGEPGVGKTRLANELIVYAQLNGATVLRGSSYEYEATTPYLPFLEALRGWVRAQDAATLRARLGDSAAELSRFAPEIESKIGPFAKAEPLSPQEERIRLFDHVARFFRSLAGGGGLLLFFDDLHWADHGTLALLHYLLRNLREAPWLALATYREVELGRDHALANVLVDWNRERLATRVTLGRFGSSETAALLATMFGQETVSEDFAKAVHRETEGNPFFIEEVVKALIEQGQIYRDRNQWQRQNVEDLTIPQSIKSAVGRRLERLSTACADVLHVAAALGKTFAFTDLAGAIEGGENVALDALDEACAAQLLRPEPDERFAFTHDKIREVLYEEQNPIRRRRLHARIGVALEKLHARDLEPHAADLAYHFSEGGELEKGLEFSLRAAGRAVKVFATEEAILHLSRARECADSLSRPEAARDIDERLGDLLRLRGEFAEALKAYERALATGPEREKYARLRLRLGETYIALSDDRAMGHLNAALEELDAGTQAHLRGQAWAMIGRHHHYNAEHARAVETLERAVAEAESSAEPEDLAFIYGYMAGAYQHLARFTESMAWARRSIELGEQRGNLTAIALGNEFMAEDLCVMGRYAEARDYATKNLELARRMGSLDREAWVYQPLATCAHGFGEMQRAIDATDQGLAVFARTGDRRGTVFLHRPRCMALVDLGRDEEALAAAEEAKIVAGGIRQVAIQCQYRQALGYFHLRRGEWQQAIEHGREIEALCHGTDHKINLLLVGRWYAPALLEAGETAEATRIANLQLELALVAQSELDRAMATAVKGMIAARAGANANSLVMFGEAIDGLDAIGERLEAARVRVRRAALRGEMGDASGAAADERAAHEVFESCGAARDLARLGR